MDYREILTSVACRCLIIVEDQFTQSRFSKARIIYDLSRTNLEDRAQLLQELEEGHSELKNQLQTFLEELDKYFDLIGVWNDVTIQGDFTSVFPLLAGISPTAEENIQKLYDAISDDSLELLIETFSRYGIGLDHPSCFDPLYDEYIFVENRAKHIRIYRDFTAGDRAMFLADLKMADDLSSVVCVIDNNMKGVNRAKEILGVIAEESKEKRKNIIGAIFSSREKFEEITNTLYFEFSDKAEQDTLKACLVRSAYSFFLDRLKNETLGRLEKAFETALTNKGIAFYISQKAKNEGISEYQVILEWITSMCYSQQGDNDTLKHLIVLARIVNSLSDEVSDEEALSELLRDVNTREAFDYSVNEFMLPVMPGDVFTNSKGKWFVLVGQDCDVVRGDGRSPKNVITELLPAICRDPESDIKKWSNDLESASIYNFREKHDAENKILQVMYQKRAFVTSEILNLCAFNTNGVCKIHISDGLDATATRLLPQYMVKYYTELQEYFAKIKTLKGCAGFADVLSQQEPTYAVSIATPVEEDGWLSYDLKRVCRLTHDYVFYLYKLYLEYRGRQPFQTINLVRQDELVMPIYVDKKKTEHNLRIRIVLSPTITNPKNLIWIVSENEINRSIGSLGFEGSIQKEQILKKESEDLQMNGTKKKLRITKAKNHVVFSQI